jgi:transposase InsO family protein
MDLVKGYYQGMMAPSSSWLTAFITPFGTYEWNRIAMGLSVAPSWFQQQIQEEVLGGLVGTVVELYIDDLLVYDKTEEGFIEKLQTLFARLQEKHIFLHPLKCAFGLKKIQFLGYEYEEGRWSMPQTKIDKILEYSKPRLAGQLKSFLGVTNYFHEFIENQASMQAPLEQMIPGYKKSKSKEVLVWTPEAEEAFLKIRDAINKCPKLHYIDEGKQLVLQTDASNYGIGAILFQKGLKDNILPIAFYSATLSSHALYWAVNEKEAYGIIAAVKHWESILSGRRFLIETDHRNLIYISQSCSPKVIRWKLALQEFMFDTKDIKGEKNEIADFLSRIPPEKEMLERKAQTENSEENFICSFIEESMGEESTNIRLDSREDHSEWIATLLDDYNYSEEQRTEIAKVHNSQVGHFGVQRTLERLRSLNRNWEHMRVHVRKFISLCPICQKLSHENVEISTKPYTVSSRNLMEVISIDAIGPLNFKAGEQKYINVFIDCFSRFVELYAVDSLEAEQTAKCLWNFIGRYGTPLAIRTDRGTDYMSKLFSELTRLSGMFHEKSIAHSKQENSIVERANKEVMRHLRGIFLDGRIAELVEEDLPAVQRIMNSSYHSSIGTKPCVLLYGGYIDLDRQILHEEEYKESEVLKETQLSEWIKDRISKSKLLLEIAHAHQDEIDVTNTAKRTAEELTHFPVGSYVLAKWPQDRPPNKAAAPLEGPLRVVEVSGSVYKLQNLVTEEIKAYHIANLRLFEFDPQTTDPVQFALDEAQQKVVESVVEHEDTEGKNHIKDFNFFIKWKGKDENFNAWLPWKELRQNSIVHEYMKRNGLSSKIPKEFKK